MVIDTSAILAWLKGEPERERIVRALEAPPTRRLSAVGLLEAQIVVRSREHPALIGKLHRFLEEIEAIVVAFDEVRRELPPAPFNATARGKDTRRNSTWATARFTRSPGR